MKLQIRHILTWYTLKFDPYDLVYIPEDVKYPTQRNGKNLSLIWELHRNK